MTTITAETVVFVAKVAVAAVASGAKGAWRLIKVLNQKPYIK